jgi:pimeloyl-ACP methyl ester carboxylesterase
VFVIGWIVSALEVAWEGPPRAFFERLASFSRLILMDKRGTGLSDRVEGIPNLETRMDDVRAVMDAVGSERAAIFGVSEGGPMAALFAATSPARTAALILEGTTATFHADQRSPVAGDARGAVALAEFRSGVGDLGQQRMG